MLCGYLESVGIRATYDKGGVTKAVLKIYSGPGIGPQEILVAAADVEAAREALAAVDQPEPNQ
jgi:hypothetical protein